MRHGVILGRTRCGKTRWAEKLSIKLVEKDPPCRVVFWNTQWNALGGLHTKTPEQLYAVLEECKTQPVFVCHYPSFGEGEIEELSEFITWLFEFQTRAKMQTVVIVDEIDKYCTKYILPTEVKDLWTKGLAFGICGIGISQRPQLIHNTILTQNFWIVVFDMAQIDKEWFNKNVLDMSQLDFTEPYTAYHYDFTEVRKVQ